MSAAGGRSERAEDEARGVTLGIGGGFEPGRVDAPPAGISGRRGESGRGNSLLELGDCDAHAETTSDATARPGTLRGVAGAARGKITSQNREISLCCGASVALHSSSSPVGICEMWKVWFVDQERESPTRRRAFSPGRPAPGSPGDADLTVPRVDRVSRRARGPRRGVHGQDRAQGRGVELPQRFGLRGEPLLDGHEMREPELVAKRHRGL